MTRLSSGGSGLLNAELLDLCYRDVYVCSCDLVNKRGRAPLFVVLGREGFHVCSTGVMRHRPFAGGRLLHTAIYKHITTNIALLSPRLFEVHLEVHRELTAEPRLTISYNVILLKGAVAPSSPYFMPEVARDIREKH